MIVLVTVKGILLLIALERASSSDVYINADKSQLFFDKQEFDAFQMNYIYFLQYNYRLAKYRREEKQKSLTRCAMFITCRPAAHTGLRNSVLPREVP